MLYMLKEMAVPTSELRYLCIECPCKTKVVLDLGDMKGSMDHCPMCGEYLPQQLAHDIVSFTRAYKNANQQPTYKLSFRIEAPE
jgi:hypothetical protein